MARTPNKHQPPPGVVLSTVPTIRGRAGAHAWLNEVLGVPVRLNYVRAATAKGEIPCTKIGGALVFSSQSLFEWTMGLTEEATA